MTHALAAMLLVALAAMASPAAAMTFAVSVEGDCALRTCVIARGQIEQRSTGDFKAFVRRHRVPRESLVVLDSGGGIVAQGIELGAYFREQGYSTHVQGPGASCASACVYAYLGGVQRTVSDGGRVGVHQMSQNPGMVAADSSASQALLSRIAKHLRRMGATMDVLTVAMRVPPQRIYWLTAAELARFHVITG